MLSIMRAARFARRAAGRGIALLGLTTVLVAPAGCGSDAGTGPDNDDPSGMYALVQVDQSGLPAKVHHGPWLDPATVTFYNQFICYVTSASFVLTDDGEFRFEMAVEWTADGTPGNGYVTFSGSYEINGSTITFTPEGTAATFTADIDDGEIWLELDLMGVGNMRWYGFEK